MDNELILQDFENRCHNLRKTICESGIKEESPRVWVAVLTLLLVDVGKMQSDPKGAIEQVIEVLRREIG